MMYICNALLLDIDINSHEKRAFIKMLLIYTGFAIYLSEMFSKERLMKRIQCINVISGIVLLVLAITLSSCSKKVNTDTGNNPPLKATFTQYIKGRHKPVLVDFGSTTCVPCKMMIPVLEELKTKYTTNLETIFINVIEDQEKTKEFNIKTIPTQVFFDNKGNEISRHIGFISTADILETFKSSGIDIKP